VRVPSCNRKINQQFPTIKGKSINSSLLQQGNQSIVPSCNREINKKFPHATGKSIKRFPPATATTLPLQQENRSI
jgi:hypothetical protein